MLFGWASQLPPPTHPFSLSLSLSFRRPADLFGAYDPGLHLFHCYLLGWEVILVNVIDRIIARRCPPPNQWRAGKKNNTPKLLSHASNDWGGKKERKKKEEKKTKTNCVLFPFCFSFSCAHRLLSLSLSSWSFFLHAAVAASEKPADENLLHENLLNLLSDNWLRFRRRWQQSYLHQ